MTKESKGLSEELKFERSQLTTVRRKYSLHLQRDHVGKSKGIPSRGCHQCNIFTDTINLITLNINYLKNDL